jgi:hypothetical protein
LHTKGSAHDFSGNSRSNNSDPGCAAPLFGGTPYLPTTFRWGYGWPFPRGYKVLTKEEKLKISTEMGIYDNNRLK